MKKIVLFILLVVFWVAIFFPKIFLWDYFVKEMESKNISVVAKKVDINLWLLYNHIKIKSLTLLKSFEIDSLNIKQDALSPLHVKFYGVSEYGVFRGEVAIVDKKGFILFEKTDLKKAMFRSYFKKHKEGMKYEFTY